MYSNQKDTFMLPSQKSKKTKKSPSGEDLSEFEREAISRLRNGEELGG